MRTVCGYMYSMYVVIRIEIVTYYKVQDFEQCNSNFNMHASARKKGQIYYQLLVVICFYLDLLLLLLHNIFDTFPFLRILIVVQGYD